MKAQIDKIRRVGRERLVSILERIGPMPLEEYSASLWEHSPAVEMERELKKALGKEFEANRWPEPVADRALEHLEKHRVLQTATHLTASEGPTFLAVHRMATAGLAEREPYLVGAYSGVPFSNAAWSGCLNFSTRFGIRDVLAAGAKDLRAFERADADRMRDGVTDSRRISLLPSGMRDALVFRAPAPARTREVADQLKPSLKSLAPAHGDAFCRFALGLGQALTRKALQREQMWYLDLNEVAASYLREVLPRPEHPMHRLLFDANTRQGLEAAIGASITWFYIPLGKRQGRQFSKVVAAGDELVVPGGNVPLDPEAVCQMLERGLFCPGVLATLASLAFVNGFRCLGSFEQVDYLERYRGVLSDLQWPAPGALDRVDTGALTTGRCLDADGVAVYPLDVALGLQWKPGPAGSVWDLIEPLVPRLLGKARA